MFDVIIPTYQNLTELKSCLEGFRQQTSKCFRILLCIDGHPDKTMEYIESMDYPFKIKVLYHLDKKQHGRNPTRNLGLSHIRSPYLLMLDSDFIPDSTLIATHAALLNQKNCISIGEILYIEYKDKKLGAYIQSRGKNKFLHQSEISIQYFNTGNVAFQSKYFVELDGQDPRMTSYGGGDLEFGYRLQKMYQLPLIFNKMAVAEGIMDKSFGHVLSQLEEFGAVNLPYIREKHPEFKSFFRADLIEGTSFHARVVRSMMNPFIRRMVYLGLEALPKIFNTTLIHYLFFYHILKGYRNKDVKNITT